MAGAICEITPDVQRMMERVARSGAVVSSQQRGEAELSFERKMQLLSGAYQKNHCIFLSRFGPNLAEEDLACFDERKFEEGFYIKAIRKQLDPAYQRRLVRNRRNDCMQGLLEGGEYFSDRAMSLRSPLLFEQYIGQYLSDEERKAVELEEEEEGQCALSAMLMFQMQQDRRSRLLAKQREQEHEEELVCGMDEMSLPTVASSKPQPRARTNNNGGGANHGGGGGPGDEQSSQAWGEVMEEKSGKVNALAGLGHEERAQLRHEFLSVMKQSFLDGNDKDFDYSVVDGNVDYDNLETRRRDEEEVYFESEDPEDCLADEDDIAWLRARSAKRSQQPVADFEEEFDEEEEEEEEDKNDMDET